ncbi:uncharacterized protein PHALS_06536 [Plasmopara halstedii]|uniref:Uncharacterized protein n=1 Tax=Plasmopara halstedii TaxID=4781 RepID=A0A0P1B5E7_PLAHL|nr:uncharacterized protein PHALS_06536 [Plasmopara halstedii]CEG48728.1 hypothetical protein PHALS_06536 [Plasmopara halstedii]|eukprot:XP_024585097.1 hypothetical protein PHALS_06536 [Plasmopara halstedii]
MFVLRTFMKPPDLESISEEAPTLVANGTRWNRTTDHSLEKRTLNHEAMEP